MTHTNITLNPGDTVTITAPAPPAPAPVPPAPVFTFQDEFTGTALSSKWGRNYSCCGGIVVDKTLTHVKDGILHLPAKKRTDGKWASDPIDTRDTFRQLYGIFEARIRVTSKAKGLWPAFWLYAGVFGTDGDEIDIVELLGSEGMAAAHQTVHKGTMANEVYAPWAAITQFGDASIWHVYSVEWRPTFIAFSIDGKETWRTSSLLIDKPLSILLNLGVGGWAGPTDASTPSPAEMLVDWVRVRA